ncbi:LEA type 2 family protein [Methyloversatilis sp.]|uniref:LEA type 2 family protein n=1 Tax=Methyloversatilis sp. TaxID=2569862 RepID=UPI00273338D2|nr:LEA type 2 family protein [Methyloversatilis sp.]MDP2867548.1 LEA type 2 family protein [Methyloversatilis sp.]MDP3453938.1 LEA type 2 family protein [Methyloversatilis sp.]MDP3578092.1 LEA type 2 family protein [Methyloversatilis sp.]
MPAILSPPMPPRLTPALSLRLLLVTLGLALLCALTGCAGLAARDPVRINLVGVEPLQGEGFELRFAVKLRVQNPNDSVIDYDGLALELDVNNRSFATGVSDAKGSVPRFGETVISVPVTVSALSALRQALGMTEGSTLENLPFALRGKLAGGTFGTVRFSEEGRLSLPGMAHGNGSAR